MGLTSSTVMVVNLDGEHDNSIRLVGKQNVDRLVRIYKPVDW